MSKILRKGGKDFEFPDEQVQAALDRGFVVPTAEEYASARARQQPLEAAGEGILRGVSMGISDIAAEPDPMMRLRQKENPVASFAGEAVGTVAGELLLRGKGSAAATPVKSALRSSIKRNALINTAYGMGSAVSEAGLDDQELTAEKLAAGGLTGLVVGTPIGVAADFAGPIVKKAVDALGLGRAATAAKKGAVKLWEREVGAALAGTRGDLVKDAVEWGVENGVLTKGATINSAMEAAQDAVMSMEPQLLGHLDELQRRAGPERAAGVAERVRSAVMDVDPKQAANMADDFQRAAAVPARPVVRDAIPDMAVKGPSTKTIRGRSGPTQELTPNGPPPMQLVDEVPTDPIQLVDVAPSYDVPNNPWHAAWMERNGLRKKYGDTPAVEAAEKAFDDFLSESTKDYFEGAPAFLSQMGKQYDAAQHLARALKVKQAERAAAPSFGAAVKDAVMEDIDPLVAALSPKVAVGKAAYKAGQVAMDQARRFGGFPAAGALQGIGVDGTVEKLAQKFAKYTVAIPAEQLGRFAPVIANAAAGGALDLFETHLQLASSSAGPEYMERMGLRYEQPDEAGDVEARFNAISALEGAGQGLDAAVDSALNGLISGTTKAPKSKSVDGKRKMAEVEALLTNPEAAVMALPPEFLNAAPATMMAAAAKRVEVAKYLSERMPKDPEAGMPAGLRRRANWEPTPQELRKFAKLVEAAEQPASVLGRLATGEASREQLEAVRTLYPRIFSELQEKLTERLMSSKPLSVKMRGVVSLVLGPAAGGMSPQQAVVIQSSHAKVGNASNASTGKPDGRMNVDVEKNLQTQAQRLQER